MKNINPVHKPAQTGDGNANLYILRHILKLPVRIVRYVPSYEIPLIVFTYMEQKNM